MWKGTTGSKTNAARPQDSCEEHLLRAMVEEGLTLRQLVGIFRRFMSYCRCARQGADKDATR